MDKEKLEELITLHNVNYWVKNEPTISDEEYDCLIVQLQEIEPDHPLVTAIGEAAVASSGKVKHKEPMLSLNKAYSLNEVMEWLKKVCRNSKEPIKIEPKYDGISANYENGVLATRGDGEEGENITDKIDLIEVERTGFKGPLSSCDNIRGEIVIRNDDFENLYSNIKRKDGKSYKNSRNAVAGIMGLKDISLMKAQGAKVTFVDFDMIGWETEARCLPKDWPTILSEFENMPYPMDGLVIKISDKEYSDSLGNTSHHPRGQIAFKFSNVKKKSVLLDVEWSFGKNCLTPVAIIEPVEIGGVTIERATLHNAQNIVEMGLMIGDEVTIERAGDVIPYISGSDIIPGNERKEAYIKFCPCCNTKLENRGPEIYCPNPLCFETKLQLLLSSVKAVGIERLGEPTLRKMMETLGAEDLWDVFSYFEHQFLELEGFKAKSASNLYKEIQKARKVKDWQLLTSLNIPTVGKTIFKSIMEKYTISEISSVSAEELAKLDGIGMERAEKIVACINENPIAISSYMDLLDVEQTKGEVKENLPTICFSGKMNEKRSYYENIAIERGYEPVNSVKKGLDLLVVADPNSGSSKLKKAEKDGIKIVGVEMWVNNQ